MSIFKKTLSCAVLAALSTCALAGCSRQDAANETAATSSEAPSAAITETISESTTAPEQTSVPKQSKPSLRKLNPHLPKHSPWMPPRPSDSTALSMWRMGS